MDNILNASSSFQIYVIFLIVLFVFLGIVFVVVLVVVVFSVVILIVVVFFLAPTQNFRYIVFNNNFF